MKKIISALLCVILLLNSLHACYVCKVEIDRRKKSATRKIEMMEQRTRKNRNTIVYYYTLGVHKGLCDARKIMKKYCKKKMRNKFEPYPQFIKNRDVYDGH